MSLLIKNLLRSAAALAALLVLASPFTVQAAAIDDAVGDMKYNGEGVPHGLPNDTTWKYKGRIGKKTPPSNATYLAFWGQVYEPKDLNPLSNARVALKEAKMWIRWGSTWYVKTNTSSFDGGNYYEDYRNDEKIAPGDIKWDGSLISVRAGCKSSAGCGRNYHFWDAYDFSWPIGTGNNGVLARVRFKLINNSASSTNDLSKAAYLVSVGADYYTSGGTNLYDVAISRQKWASTSWRTVYAHNLTESDLRNNPPPGL
jgi:hypothetical protein